MNHKMKRTLAGVMLLLISTSQQLQADSQEDMDHKLDQWENVADRTMLDPTEENFSTLARGAKGLTYSNFPIPRREEVNRKLRSSLMAIPGFADRLLAKIHKERAIWKSGKIHDYDRVRLDMIQTLEALPSPESVRVLGELLFDDSGVPYPLEKGFEQFSPPENPFFAQVALTKLLDDPPMEAGNSLSAAAIRAQLKTWQLWFEQVKAGTRTFRFKGDPQPYTLEGPAERELRPGADGADPENHRRRTTQNREASGSEDSADDPAQRADHWWMAGGALGLVAAILLGWRKLRRTSTKR